MNNETTNVEPKRRFHIVDIGASIAELETQLKSLINEYQVDTNSTVDSIQISHTVWNESCGSLVPGLDVKVELRRPITPHDRPR